MSRNYRRDVERSLAAALDRPFLLTTCELPREIEVLLRFLVRAAP